MTSPSNTREERLATLSAGAFNGTFPRWGAASALVDGGDEQLVVTNEVAPVARDVAPLAGRDKVIRLVVPPVAVNVVGDDCPTRRKFPSRPEDCLATPVALVRAVSNPTKEDGAVLIDVPATSSKWVLVVDESLVSAHTPIVLPAISFVNPHGGTC